MSDVIILPSKYYVGPYSLLEGKFQQLFEQKIPRSLKGMP